MDIRRKVMPLVLSGTLAFGTMGVPLSAYAQRIENYDTEKDKTSFVKQDLEDRVEAGELDQLDADKILKQFLDAVKAENEAAKKALEEAEAAAAAEAQAQAEAEAAAAAAAQAQAEAEDAAAAAAQAQAEAEAAAAAEAQAQAEAETEAEAEVADGAEAQVEVAEEAEAEQEFVVHEVGGDNDGDGVDDGTGTDGDGTDGGTDGGDNNQGSGTDGQGTGGDNQGTDGGTGTDGDNSGTDGTTGDTTETGTEDGASSGAPTDSGNSGESGKTGKSGKADKSGKSGKKDSASGMKKAETEGSLAALLDARAEVKAAKGKHVKAAERKLAAEQRKYQEAVKRYNEQAVASAVAPSSFNTETNVFSSAYVGSNQGYSRIHFGTNLTTEMFIASIGEQARQIGQDKNLYASVMIAQAVIESDSGNSGLAQAPNNNLFGIKGAFEGQSVTMATQEDDGTGKLYNINSAFRTYDTQEESLKDYADLLRGDMTHYYKAWKENAETYEDAAKALQGTYATSTVYADTICAVIEAYDLTRYDKPFNFEVTTKNGAGKTITMDDYVQLQANAVSFLGTPYEWGGETPDGFDCSGFVQYLYKETFDIALPRTTYTQQYEGEEVPFEDLQMGDLLFFDEGGKTEHVAMYLDDGFYIHAPEQGDNIKISDMESFTPTFAKRILETADVEPAEGEAADAEASDAKSSDAKSSDAKASDAKASDAKASDAKASDAKSSDDKAVEAEPAEPQPVDA